MSEPARGDLAARLCAEWWARCLPLSKTPARWGTLCLSFPSPPSGRPGCWPQSSGVEAGMLPVPSASLERRLCPLPTYYRPHKAGLITQLC